MTRVNIVPVETLTNKHLLAEYKEITRPMNKIRDRYKKHGYNLGLEEQAKLYKLGSGHETFFFNKFSWLLERYHNLFAELHKREFNIDKTLFRNISLDMLEFKGKESFIDVSYSPLPEEMYLNMARLCKRSNLATVIEEIKNA